MKAERALWLARLFTKKKDTTGKEDKLDQLRELRAYKNLQGRFANGETDYKAGLPNDALTVGDLVDILDLYLNAAGGNKDYAFTAIVNIAQRMTMPESIDSESLKGEFNKLRKSGRESGITPNDFDRQHQLYALHPDLSQVVKTRVNVLSNYPGGIRLAKVLEPHDEEPKFLVVLPNSQKMDENKPEIAQVFQETGLPLQF